MTLDPAASGWSWDFVLEADSSYAGPVDPWVLVNGGTPAMADSDAVLSLGATDATEMLVSERADFADASWQPISASLPWTFHGASGARAIFTRFRDAQQRECTAVFDGARQTGASTGDLLVQADSTGARVWLDGFPVPGATDLVLSGLQVGPYKAAVTYPQHRPDPSVGVPEVQDGQQAQAIFTLTPRQAPDPFDLIDPANDFVVEDLPGGFLWRSTTDPDPVSAISYGLEASADSSFATTLVEVAGLSDTLFTPTEGYADSTHLYWRAQARSVYGAERFSDRRSFWIDRTSPTALVLSPNGGESWVAGTNDTIRWQAGDWSGVDSVSLSLSFDGGQTYTPILTPLPGDSVAVYAVPDTFATNQTTCRVRVEAFDRAGHVGADESDGDFEILGPAQLSGAVRNAQLDPIPLATIGAYADTGLVATTESDSTGAYSMNLPAATYEIRATATGYLLEIQADVVVPAGSETVLDLTLGRLLAGDTTHAPDHFAAWDFESDQTIAWESEPASVDSVGLEWSADDGASWQPLTSGQPATGSYLWTAGEIPDSSTVTARLRYTAVNAVGDTLGQVVGPSFALRRSTDLLLKQERQVFAWPVDSAAVTYQVAMDYDTLSGCGDPASLLYETGDAAPYFQLPSVAWLTLSVGRWLLSVTALDSVGGVISSRDTTAVLFDLEHLGGTGAQDPVVVLHDWGGSAADASAPGNDLASLLEAAGYEVWSLGYPSTGDLDVSAGGLSRALEAILENHTPGTHARIVAAGLGGLVARAYTQGLAVTPQGDPIAYADSIRALAAYGCPHLGAPWGFARSAIASIDGAACRARPGEAVTQVDGDRYRADQLRSAWLQELDDLGTHPLDAAADYLFAAGSSPSALGLPGLPPAIDASLARRMSGPNDGLVPVRSALADGLASGAVCAIYPENHAALGIFTTGSQKAADLTAFLADGTAPACTTPALRQIAGTIQRMGAVEGEELRTARGAVVRAYPGGTAFNGGGARDETIPVAVAVADSSGSYALPFLPEGDYRVSVTAERGLERIYNLHLDPEASGWAWDLVLEADSSYAGPINPWVVIGDGSPALADSAATLSLGVTGATEMLLSERPDFSDATWEPFSSTVPWTFSGEAGAKAVFARFRDDQARECAAATAGMRLSGPSTGSIEISADSTGAVAFLDGVPLTGGTTQLVRPSIPGITRSRRSTTASVPLRPPTPSRSRPASRRPVPSPSPPGRRPRPSLSSDRWTGLSTPPERPASSGARRPIPIRPRPSDTSSRRPETPSSAPSIWKSVGSPTPPSSRPRRSPTPRSTPGGCGPAPSTASRRGTTEDSGGSSSIAPLPRAWSSSRTAERAGPRATARRSAGAPRTGAALTRSMSGSPWMEARAGRLSSSRRWRTRSCAGRCPIPS